MTSLRTYWQRLTLLAKAMHAVGVAAPTLAAGWVVLSGLLAIPEQVRTNTHAIQVNTAAIDTLRSQSPGMQYLLCVDASDRGLIPTTPQECYQTYRFRAAEQ